LYNGITKQEILSTLEEFIDAGFETVSTTLEWIVLYLSYHKHVQKMVQAGRRCKIQQYPFLFYNSEKQYLTLLSEAVALVKYLPFA
jgi:cytochrome P450